MTKAFLAVEFVSSPEPRMCRLTGTIKKVLGRPFHEALLTPPIPRRVCRTDADVDCAFLALAQPGVELDDVGKKHVIVDIYYMPPSPTEDVAPEQITRLGMGSLHATMEAARKRSEMG